VGGVSGTENPAVFIEKVLTLPHGTLPPNFIPF
jgi:hypothetical protein